MHDDLTVRSCQVMFIDKCQLKDSALEGPADAAEAATQG